MQRYPMSFKSMVEPKTNASISSGSEPLYIYYRVYARDGAIPVKTSFDPSDPHVGRILASSVPPPHSADTLKRFFLRAEQFSDPKDSRISLYLMSSSQTRLLPQSTLILVGPGPYHGATPETAFALAFTEKLTSEEAAALPVIKVPSNSSVGPYLYYHLYTRDGEDRSDVPFNSKKPALGRIEKSHISPPHNPTSIKRCIARAEGKRIYAAAAFYQDISAANATANNCYTALFGNAAVGSTEDRPIVLVQPEWQEGLFNRPAKVISYSQSPWLRGGMMVYTDGIPKQQNPWFGAPYISYECAARDGMRTHFRADDLEFLDE
ncbi:hypothetical protein C8R44DRAFT_813700 [Mycena epipterygia]|nr:hypothetical protein C8R44DRAFT_813700 [Mycena epipterygia]